MDKGFTNSELKEIYNLFRAFDEGLIVNPSQEWELDHYDESLVNKNGLKFILNKIKKLLPKEEFEEINKKILLRKYSNFNNEIDETVYNILVDAFDARKTVEIGYFDISSAEVNKRAIDIYHKTRKYVIAYCHLRKAMRKFRTSRIISAKITSKKYTIPVDFDKSRY